MSAQALEALQAELGDKILSATSQHGDDTAQVAPADWAAAATFLRNQLAMDHFVDLTAVDWPERADGTRFDIRLSVRSSTTRARVHLKTQIPEASAVPTLCEVWAGANWAEREVWDMFGIRFEGHPDLRRILMYEEFEGHPLRKDYPIGRTQPLVPYRDADNIQKLDPFGPTEGQPFGRVQWQDRLEGNDQQVSPSIAHQSGQRPQINIEKATPLAATPEGKSPERKS